MIRKVEEKDRDIYIEMSKAFYRSDAVLHMIPEIHFLTTFDLIVTGSPYAEGYVFEYQDEVVGYTLLSFTYSNEAGGLVLLIEEVYILPDYQGHGFGQEFLAFLESTYRSKVALIRLEVEKSNKSALQLYRKMGFTKTEYIQLYKRPAGVRKKIQ